MTMMLSLLYYGLYCYNIAIACLLILIICLVAIIFLWWIKIYNNAPILAVRLCNCQ